LREQFGLSSMGPTFFASDWCGLSWTGFVQLPMRPCSDRSIPTGAGVYRVRVAGRDELAYIGQTGRNLNERLRGLGAGLHAAEIPFNDPHTAAPKLWVCGYRHLKLRLVPRLGTTFSRFLRSRARNRGRGSQGFPFPVPRTQRAQNWALVNEALRRPRTSPSIRTVLTPAPYRSRRSLSGRGIGPVDGLASLTHKMVPPRVAPKATS
jgi:hypothetical protein